MNNSEYQSIVLPYVWLRVCGFTDYETLGKFVYELSQHIQFSVNTISPKGDSGELCMYITLLSHEFTDEFYLIFLDILSKYNLTYSYSTLFDN